QNIKSTVNMRGKFITLEGIDGAGKSTQLEWLADFWRARGHDLVMTREPGGTALGEQLRKLLLDSKKPMHAETETLLMFAARREHIHQVILPNLEAGRWVLCDRFTDATFAYQGGGRGLGDDSIRRLESLVQGARRPDLTLLLDVPVAIGLQRARRRNEGTGIGQADQDRFELQR